MPKNRKSYTLPIVQAVTLIVLTLYFSLNTIYVSPSNPLRDTLGPLLDETIGAYFPQDWNLFAPLPRTADLALLVRPLTNKEAQLVKTHGLPTNGWYNLSEPLWTRFQQNRFSAYNRLGRPADQAVAHYLTEPQPQATRLMIKLASTFCKDIGERQARFVALAIYERLSRPWLAKDTLKPRVIQTTFVGIFPIDRTIEKSNVYRPGEQNGPLP